ncbi:MAG: CDP-diacylglycerol--serine O-phosphatidyltransferase [Gemmatimonadetes bacterium]|nr:CDP-diacylglycerol--serine O-phosphatidyltransferase [Gemmatimonadota bacterium]
MNGRLQRGIIILPGALTMANLFFGVWAIVAAAQGDFMLAAWFVVIAGVADTLDGRVARVTRTGSRFGEELDSLVDAISFGVAPAFIIYHLYLADGRWSWVAAFFYISAITIRLARFNVEQAGHAKVAFHGLPSPSAGMTLATFYPFSQTTFFATYLAHWAWPELMTALMILLGLLMMSHVLYPVVPKFGIRNLRGMLTGLFLLSVIILAIVIPSMFFFPALMGYITYGVLKALVLGFFDRLPERDPLLDEEPDEAGAEVRTIDYAELSPGRAFRLRGRRRRRRRSREADRRPDRPISIEPPGDRPRKAGGQP